ncbi:unnamed protein product [Arctia plantaginis]|uniref:Uncharacterized protein n=1 Tax=Arctia plantaginis TaxID=874455 RepID=A0A8S1BPW7_ARCPL|nr:unnamed protein product [Arctia plantaginis]
MQLCHHHLKHIRNSPFGNNITLMQMKSLVKQTEMTEPHVIQPQTTRVDAGAQHGRRQYDHTLGDLFFDG